MLPGILDAIACQPHGDDNPFASTQTDIQRKMDDFARGVARCVNMQR